MHDLVDWVGGYPFEVAKPEEVLDFCRMRGFALRRLKTVGGLVLIGGELTTMLIGADVPRVPCASNATA